MSSLGRTSAAVIIFSFVSWLPGGTGLDCTMSPPFLAILLWFLLYIFSCRRSFLIDSSLPHQQYSVNSNFDVSMGRGELRVFLLCHLGHSQSCILYYAILYKKFQHPWIWVSCRGPGTNSPWMIQRDNCIEKIDYHDNSSYIICNCCVFVIANLPAVISGLSTFTWGICKNK